MVLHSGDRIGVVKVVLTVYFRVAAGGAILLNRELMEDLGDKSAIQVIEISLPRRKGELVRVPRTFLTSPLFAATKQTGPREVLVRITAGDEVFEQRFLIGGFHPMDPALKPPALDTRHATALFSLLAFRTEYDDAQLIRFSFNEFCHKYAQSNGGRYSRDIKKILRDLMDSYIRVTDVKTNIDHEYRLIERIDIEKRPPRRRDSRLALSNQKEMWFNGCTLSREFADILGRDKELQSLRIDVFNSIRSGLAQAIYLYIPSRAHFCTKDAPFEITLTNLLRQVGARIPKYKSKRAEVFTKNKNPVIEQLDGLETLWGVFRVKLKERNDGTDWKLQAWEEKNRKPNSTGWTKTKLYAAYLKSGRPVAYFHQALSSIPSLDEYELDLLTSGNVIVGKNRRFFEAAKAILKPCLFRELLHEAKGAEMEGQKATKNQTARLIHRIMKTIASPAKPISKASRMDLDS